MFLKLQVAAPLLDCQKVKVSNLSDEMYKSLRKKMTAYVKPPGNLNRDGLLCANPKLEIEPRGNQACVFLATKNSTPPVIADHGDPEGMYQFQPEGMVQEEEEDQEVIPQEIMTLLMVMTMVMTRRKKMKMIE